MDLHCRPLTKMDYDVIVQIIDQWWGGPTAALAHPMFFYELGRLARVVEAEEQIIGFLFGFLCPDASVGYVHLVGIHPSYRRRGVGRLLYQAFQEDCRREGCRLLKAITTMGNVASIEFHRALGWGAAQVDDYAGPGRQRVVFTHEISRL